MSTCPPQLEPSWKTVLEEEFNKPYMEALKNFIAQERTGSVPIFPPPQDVFNSFLYTPYNQVKAVIVGQDPYHGPKHAHGLCFSVQHGIVPPPSLKNIFIELQNDLGIKIPDHGSLTSWAKQGVLLLNATLTVKQGSPMSHHKKGWEEFTDAVIKSIARQKDPVVFLLWGKSAQQKCQYLLNAENQTHLVLIAAHPSPFSAYQGFFGCRHFSRTNTFLAKHGKTPIDWNL